MEPGQIPGQIPEQVPAQVTDSELWPGAARIAVSLVVNVEEGSELSLRDGDRGPEPVDELGVVLKKPVRNYANESNYRYGIRAGAPRVLGLLDRFGMPATFTAAALSLERAPDLARRIAAAGHEVASHGYRWIHQFRMSEPEEREFVEKAVRSIEQSVGQRPLGWLSRYLTTEHTCRLLAESGFVYYMDDYSDDLPFWNTEHAHPLVVMPYALDSNDMKMWTAPAYTPAMWLAYACDTFDQLYREGEEQPKMMSLGLHLRVIGRPGRIASLERFLEHVSKRRDVWVATRLQIAQQFAKRHPAPVEVSA